MDTEKARISEALQKIENLCERAEADSELGAIRKIAQRGLYGRLLTKNESKFDTR